MNKPGQQPTPEKKSVWLAELYPLILDTLSSGGSFKLTVTGTSMIPTLRGGRDSVVLSRAPEALAKYDLPLYRRRNGSFVLHRVVRVEADGSYTMCGDHQWRLEQGIRREQIVGLVTQLERKGRVISVHDRGYLRRVRFWVRVLPLRRVILRICILPGSIRRRLTRKV